MKLAVSLFVVYRIEKETQMITRSNIALAFMLAGVLQATGSAAPQATNAEEQKGGTVLLDESFEGFDADVVPQVAQLQRVDKVTVVDGGGKVGSGKVAYFNDSDTGAGGAMEYNFGSSGLGSMYVEFDALNNAPTSDDKSSTVIFGVGPWAAGKSLMLNSKAKRAFGFEMYQQKYLKLRVGSDAVAQLKYDSAQPFNVKIWANDHDENTLTYKRPDSGEEATLNADSVVVWVNNALIGKLEATGCPMHREVTQGDAVIGRAGFSSSSKKLGMFLIDNLHIEGTAAAKDGASDEKKPAATTDTANPSATEESTPKKLPGGETMSYRDGENAMDLFVFKPEGWKASDKRSAFVFFFGGGWTKGTPLKSASTAAWAAKNGMGFQVSIRNGNRVCEQTWKSFLVAKVCFRHQSSGASK